MVIRWSTVIEVIVCGNSHLTCKDGDGDGDGDGVDDDDAGSGDGDGVDDNGDDAGSGDGVADHDVNVNNIRILLEIIMITIAVIPWRTGLGMASKTGAKIRFIFIIVIVITIGSGDLLQNHHQQQHHLKYLE